MLSESMAEPGDKPHHRTTDRDATGHAPFAFRFGIKTVTVRRAASGVSFDPKEKSRITGTGRPECPIMKIADAGEAERYYHIGPESAVTKSLSLGLRQDRF
jgi:hypothetical protein